MAKPNRTAGEQEFADWLDTVATPVDTSRPLVDPTRDYAQEKHDKREAYRHRWLMRNNFWYRQSHIHSRQQEQLRLEAELAGKEYIEPEPLEQDEQGFWEQF